MAQSVERPTSAQVMISRFVGSSSVSDSMLTPQSLEPASDSVFPSLYAPPWLALCLLKRNVRGAWVAQSVERPTSAQVAISRSVSSSLRRALG